MARLRIVDVVEKEDVNEAMRLMEMSKDSLVLGQEDSKGRPQSITDKIFAVIREMAQTAKTLKIADIKERSEILLKCSSLSNQRRQRKSSFLFSFSL